MTENTKENIDPVEIKKFTDLASRWWDPNSDFATLHRINPLRANYINLHTPVKGLKVLDVGCGGGLLSEALAEMGAEVTGIDMGEASLSVAKLHLLESGNQVEYLQITAEQLAREKKRHYDIVTCLEMLEHVPDPRSVVAACSTLLKDNGHAYFSTINRNLKSWLFAIVGAEYILKLLPKGTHQYDKLITPAELESMSSQANLVAQQLIGLHYNPITKHYKLAEGVDVNFMMLTHKNTA